MVSIDDLPYIQSTELTLFLLLLCQPGSPGFLERVDRVDLPKNKFRHHLWKSSQVAHVARIMVGYYTYCNNTTLILIIILTIIHHSNI